MRNKKPKTDYFQNAVIRGRERRLEFYRYLKKPGVTLWCVLCGQSLPPAYPQNP